MDFEKPESHGSHCERAGIWYVRKECREFSTDGSGLGARIAHLYGTTCSKTIDMIQEAEMRADKFKHLTGMEEEQKEWEEGLDDSDDS